MSINCNTKYATDDKFKLQVCQLKFTSNFISHTHSFFSIFAVTVRLGAFNSYKYITYLQRLQTNLAMYQIQRGVAVSKNNASCNATIMYSAQPDEPGKLR